VNGAASVSAAVWSVCRLSEGSGQEELQTFFKNMLFQIFISQSARLCQPTESFDSLVDILLKRRTSLTVDVLLKRRKASPGG